MKLIKSLTLTILFTAFLFFTSCIKDPQFGPAEIGVFPESVDFGVEAGSATINLFSNRDWHAEIISGDETPTWLTLSDTSGVAMNDSLGITITVLPNSGEDRQATINFRTETIYSSVRVSQKGSTQKQYTPISTVRALYKGTDIAINEDYIIKGSVISNYMNSEYGGLNNATSTKTVVISDGEYGISLYLAANNTMYSVGDQITVKLNGLTLQRYNNGSLQVNAVPLANIEKVGEYIIAPVTITAAQLVSGDFESMYVSVPDVEIADSDMGKKFVESEKHTSINFVSKTGEKFVVFSSSYSTFGGEAVPTGSGTLKGIAMVYGSTFQMSVTALTDYSGLTGERFATGGGGGGDNPTNTISVTELVSHIKTNMSDVASGSQKELASVAGFVEGIVAANNDGNNLYSTLSIVDNTGAANSGILLYNSGITGYSVGDKIKVSLGAAMYKNYNGLRELSWDSFDASYITKVSSDNTFTVPEITASQVRSNDYQGMYVKVIGLTSDNEVGAVWNSGSTNNVNTTFKDAEGNIVYVRTYKNCTWATNTIATGVTSSISGVAEIYNTDIQILPTKEADIQGFNGASGPTFSVSPSTKTVTAPAGTFTINVNASEGVAWTVSSSDATNFAVSPASGTADGTVTVTYTENTSETDDRTATITFVTEDASITNKTVTCAITQSKKSSGGEPVYTSNVTLPAENKDVGTGAYGGKANIGGTEFSILKIGKSSAGGSYTFAAPLPATGNCTLNFYGVAWNGKTCTLTVTVNNGGTIDGETSKQYVLNPNAGASGNPTYTITFGTNDYYTANLVGITASSTITVSTIDAGPRCILAGININAAN